MLIHLMDFWTSVILAGSFHSTISCSRWNSKESTWFRKFWSNYFDSPSIVHVICGCGYPCGMNACQPNRLHSNGWSAMANQKAIHVDYKNLMTRCWAEIFPSLSPQSQHHRKPQEPYSCLEKPNQNWSFKENFTDLILLSGPNWSCDVNCLQQKASNLNASEWNGPWKPHY